ncbi:MAG: DUF2723 domain-containing protein [Gemmatimonadota bacterium]
MTARVAARQAALTTGLLLVAVYLATAAPSLTFWDASEFATAFATFGIPHPPGTPLYVSLGAAIWRLVPGLSPVQAGTLLSAVATAVACAGAAWIVAESSGQRVLAIIAGTSAGLMGTVWMNATETEVYAVSLLLVAAQLLAAWHAHRTDDDRARVLLMYLAALSIPVHLSALVATPAALLLASTDSQGRVRWWSVATGTVMMFAIIAASRAELIVAGVLLLCAVALHLVARRGRDGSGTLEPVTRRPTSWVPLALVTTLLAWSAVAILLVRARHSPFLNQGDPDTFRRLLDVISRAQYDVAALWPRRAPPWLQLGNIAQYADWQVALSLWNDVTTSWWRTPFTLLALGVGAVGAVAHWRGHRITARVTLLLLVLATVGVCAQLNLRAGPSYGVGVLPAGALHEARERDYFFALAFWVWGLWIGIGACALARRRQVPVALAAVVPLAMCVGSWRAVTRAAWPDRSLASAVAGELLQHVPRNGLLLTAGDNDTYPLWYRQAVDGLRPDVQVVVMSLLPADWYLREGARRAGPFRPDTALAANGVVRAAWLAREKLGVRGAVAVSILVDADARAELGRRAGITCWRRAGMVDIGSVAREVCPPRVDAERSFDSARRLAPFRTAASPRQSPDGMVNAFLDLARCPALAADLAMTGVAAGDSIARGLLDITCNLR